MLHALGQECLRGQILLGLCRKIVRGESKVVLRSLRRLLSLLRSPRAMPELCPTESTVWSKSKQGSKLMRTWSVRGLVL